MTESKRQAPSSREYWLWVCRCTKLLNFMLIHCPVASCRDSPRTWACSGSPCRPLLLTYSITLNEDKEARTFGGMRRRRLSKIPAVRFRSLGDLGATLHEIRRYRQV